jgi:hypothetical protein
MSEKAVGGARLAASPGVTQPVCEYHVSRKLPFNLPRLAPPLDRVVSKVDAPKDKSALAGTTSFGRAAR